MFLPNVFHPAFLEPARAEIFETPPAFVIQDETRWFTLGEITAFGQADIDGRKLPERKVIVRFPESPIPKVPESAPHLNWGDWKIELNEWGNLGRLYRDGGGWPEFKKLYEEAQQRIASGNAKVWKCKAVIFTHTDVLYKRADGVLEAQRGAMSEEDVNLALETFARFEALVEAFTRGAVDMQLTFSVETDPVIGYYEKEDVWSLHPFTAGDVYLRGRFNTGDFDCILYMYHPGAGRAYSFGGTIGRTNNATQAYVILSNGREQGPRIGHSEAMLHEWYHQIEDTYSKYGYGGHEYSWLPELHGATQNGYVTDTVGYTGWFSWLRDLLSFSVRPSMWAKMDNKTEPDWATVRAQTHRSDGSAYSWENVKDDPWAKLPFLTPEDIAKKIGASSVDVQVGESQVLFLPRGGNMRTALLPQLDAEDFSLNNQLNFMREAVARIGYNDRDLLFVRFDAADYVISHLADHPAGVSAAANVLGFINVGAKIMVVVDTKLNNDTLAELNILNLGASAAGIAAHTKGNFNRAEPIRVSFFADAPDVRFSVTTADGTAVPIQDGVISLPGAAGTRLLNVVAALPSGERIERPFVVRLLDPVSTEVSAVGTRRMFAPEHRLTIMLKNREQAATAKLRVQAPAGWSVTGVPQEVQLAPGESRKVTATVSAPSGVADGPYEIAVEASFTGYAGPATTQRITIERETKPTLVNNTFNSNAEGWDAVRTDNAGWTAVTEEIEGESVLAVRDRGGARWGRVNAFGGYLKNGQKDPNFMGYEAEQYPYLDFKLKTEFEHNLALVVTLSDGKRYTIMLAGPYQEQWGESKQLPRAKFIPNGEWQRIVYDLNSALRSAGGEGEHYVVDIGFGDSRQFSSNQFFSKDIATHYIDDFRITRDADLSNNTTKDDPDAELSSGADAASTRADARARAAAGISESSSAEAKAAVRALLADRDNTVRLNAAAAFTHVKDPVAVPKLAQALSIERDSYATIYMVRALEFQDTPEAWAAIAALVRQTRAEQAGPAEAALAMGRKKDPKFIKDILLLLTSPSWQTRRDAVKALYQIGTDEAQRAALVFLLEIDPMVRLEVARGADPDVDPVARRMEWGSINDLSNVVRAYCYAALTRSADPVTRSRGYAGLKEPDTSIRRIILQEIGNDSKEYHVQQLLGMLSDPSPDVRTAALESLLKMPGSRSFSEMTVLAGEDYEQVLFPLLQAAKAKRLELPQAMLERLARHRNPDIRNLVKELVNS